MLIHLFEFISHVAVVHVISMLYLQQKRNKQSIKHRTKWSLYKYWTQFDRNKMLKTSPMSVKRELLR